MGWADVLGKLIDLLKTAPGAGIFLTTVITLFLSFTMIVGGLLYLNWDTSNRIVTEIRGLRQDLMTHNLAKQ